jgi:hypothetical protein
MHRIPLSAIFKERSKRENENKENKENWSVQTMSFFERQELYGISSGWLELPVIVDIDKKPRGLKPVANVYNCDFTLFFLGKRPLCGICSIAEPLLVGSVLSTKCERE